MTSPLGLEKTFLRNFTDSDPSKCSDTAMHNIGGHYQAGTATRCIAHYRQIYEAKRFQYFDHESDQENQRAYGQASPPEIDLQAFSDLPIAIFGGKEDLLVSPGDYTWLRDELSTQNNCKYFKEYDLGHLGLIAPKDKTIFDDMLALTAESISDSSKLQMPDTETFERTRTEVKSILSQMSASQRTTPH